MVVWSKDMKIKKSRLRRIIQEEVTRVMSEVTHADRFADRTAAVQSAIADIEKRFGQGSVMTPEQMQASRDERAQALAAQAERRAQVAAQRKAELDARPPLSLSPRELMDNYGIQMVPAHHMANSEPETIADLHAKGDEIQGILNRAGLGNIGHRQFRNLWGDDLSGYGAPWGPRGVFTAAGNMASGQRVPDLSIINPQPYRLGTETQELFGMLSKMSTGDLNALQRAAQEFRSIYDGFMTRNREAVIRSSSMIPSN
jgi:hypothetical protein